MIRAAARLPGPHEARGDGVGRVEPGAEVPDRDPALDRAAAGLAGDAHQPAHALHGDVERALARIGSGLTVPRDRAVHDPRIAGAHRGVVRAEAREHPGSVVLDEHVGRIGEPKQPIDAGAVLEVEDDAALVAVERGEVLAVGGPAVGGRGERRPASHAVASVGAFDLDDIRPEIREQRAGERSCRDLAELDGTHSGERPLAGYWHTRRLPPCPRPQSYGMRPLHTVQTRCGRRCPDADGSRARFNRLAPSTASASSVARSSRRISCHRNRTELRTISSSSAISSGMIGA